jgi:hypothetical protein
MDFLINQKKNLKRSHSSEEDLNELQNNLICRQDECKLNNNETNKRIRTDSDQSAPSQLIVVKNALQLLNEIKHFTSIKFKLLTREGPAHQPLFKISLTVMLEGNEFIFYGIGKKIQNSKIMASMRALLFLIRRTDFFNQVQKRMYESSLLAEAKLLKMDPREIFVEELNNEISIEQEIENDSVENSPQKESNSQITLAESQSSTKLTIDIKEEPVTQPILNETLKEQAEVASPIVIENRKLDANLIKIESRVSEFVEKNNLLSLINYLIPPELMQFNVSEYQAKLDSSKNFHCELIIVKNFPENARSVYYKKSNLVIPANNSNIRESNEHLFINAFGKNKAFSKFNASKIALELLFNITLNSKSGKEKKLNFIYG